MSLREFGRIVNQLTLSQLSFLADERVGKREARGMVQGVAEARQGR